MPVEMFIRLDGIQGDSRNYQHKGWSDILEWNWGMSAIVNSENTRKTLIDEITITKQIGTDSTDFMLLFSQGKTVKNAEINIIPTVAKREARQKYLHMQMEDVSVKSIHIGGSTGDDIFKEQITLNFSKVRLTYNPYLVASAENPTAVSRDYKYGWDIKANKELQE